MQTPKIEDAKYKYYKDENTNTLVLKPGHDFPKDIVVEGMDYDTFISQILNKIGNLRIYYRDKNSGRQNTAIELKEYNSFTMYSNIKERGKEWLRLYWIIVCPNPKLIWVLYRRAVRKEQKRHSLKWTS